MPSPPKNRHPCRSCTCSFDISVAQQLRSEPERPTDIHFNPKGQTKCQNRTVTDGPFAETKELIAGFWFWQVKSLEEAIEWVKRCPNPHEGDTDIEIRQILEPEDFASAFNDEEIQKEKNFRAQMAARKTKKY